MTQSNELKNNFQKAIIVPTLFLVMSSFCFLFLLSDIILNPTITKEMAYVNVFISYFIVFVSTLVIQLFAIRPLLIKLKNVTLNFKEMANRDYLTGLMNRNALIHTYWILQQQQNSDTGHIIVILDLDKFKLVNDQYGHACGDKVLQHISTLIKHNIRTSDSCYRVGGEEFTLILPDTSVIHAMQVLEKIRTTIATTPCHFGTTQIKSTCTFGLAKINLQNNLETNMSNADKALYDGKKNGRNTVCAYSDGN